MTKQSDPHFPAGSDEDRPEYAIAYAAVAFSGAIMGFLGGLWTGWMVWTG